MVEAISWPAPQTDDKGHIIKTFEPVANDVSEKECEKIFKAKHKGVSVEMIYGPVYEVKEKTADKPKVGITVSARDMSRLTGKVYEGTYGGWNVYCNGLKGLTANGKKFGDNDLVRPVFESQIDPAAKKPRPRMKQAEALLRSDLESCKEVNS